MARGQEEERNNTVKRLEKELWDLTDEKLWDRCEVTKTGEYRRECEKCFWLINWSLQSLSRNAREE